MQRKVYKKLKSRYFNHLESKINKDVWTRDEEKILFIKHMELGNKWSKIAKFLTKRTLNAIKNHFYSKFRKFLRRAIRQLNKDDLIKNTNGYIINTEKLYLVIKKLKITFENLSKERILEIIENNYNTLISLKSNKLFFIFFRKKEEN